MPPGELERVLSGLGGRAADDDLLVGLENGDDAAVVRVEGDRAVVLTADFFTPVVDDAYDWGRIAAANALSDVYAMGGDPLVAVNLLVWPRDRIPFDLAAEVLRGGADVCAEAGCHLAGGHTIDDPEPKYGLAVTGLADPARLLRNDAGVAGTPLTLTKPLEELISASLHGDLTEDERRRLDAHLDGCDQCRSPATIRRWSERCRSGGTVTVLQVLVRGGDARPP